MLEVDDVWQIAADKDHVVHPHSDGEEVAALHFLRLHLHLVIIMQKKWLHAVPWESVVTVNKALCQAQKLEPTTKAGNLEAARHEGSSDLQPDEAGTDDYRRPRPAQVADDGAAVSERPKVAKPLTALDVEADRVCTRGDEKGAIVLRASVAEPHGFGGGIDLHDFDSR